MDDGTGTPLRPPPFVAAMAAAAAPAVSPAGSATAYLSAPSGICVFSGGTAANSLVDVFQALAAHLGSDPAAAAASARPCLLAYIIPISDNGGSSSELIRFFGGPSVGDIRSRLVRLIPTTDDNGSTDTWDGAFRDPALSAATNAHAALRALMEHRLCTSDPRQARDEWLDLVEARHLLWTFVPGPTRELIRAVLNTLNLEIVKRVRPTSVFNFAGASVGNLFLTGARLFSGSFEAAIYLLSLLCGIPDHVVVLPAINSNFTHHISAGLVDGTDIAGQVNISHPSAPTSLPDGTVLSGTAMSVITPVPRMRGRAATATDFEDATLPGSLPALRRPQIAFSKGDEEDLPARIARIWYINPYGHEIRPPANPKALAALQQARAIVYSIGSLYTSIIPSLVLRGVGAAILHGDRPKVLILNSKLDRETGPRHDPMTAVDFVRAITSACRESQEAHDPDQVHTVDADCRQYVTHVVYLAQASKNKKSRSPGFGGPLVDEEALGHLGIRSVPVPSQGQGQGQGQGQSQSQQGQAKNMERYDEAALTEALQRIVGEAVSGIAHDS